MFPKLHASVCQQNGLGAGALDGAFTDKTLLFQEFQHMDHAGMPDGDGGTDVFDGFRVRLDGQKDESGRGSCPGRSGR